MNFFGDLWSSITSGWDEVTDVFTKIYDFFASIINGSFFVWLWQDVMLPYIIYALELFFLAMLILPLALVNLVGDVVDVFSGVKTIEDTRPASQSRAIGTEGMPGTGRYSDDVYIYMSPGINPKSVEVFYQTDSRTGERFYHLGLENGVYYELYRSAEALGYTNPNYLDTILPGIFAPSRSMERSNLLSRTTTRHIVDDYLEALTPGNKALREYTGSPYFTQKLPEGSYPIGEEFFMSLALGPARQATLQGAYHEIWLGTYFHHKIVWRSFIQQNDSMVRSPSLSYTDRNRYTEAALEIMARSGVQPGSEGMYLAISDALRQQRQDEFSTGTLRLQETRTNARITLLEYFMGQPAINTVFWGVTIISIALCLGFSIIAVVRSMGDLQQNRPLGKVLGSVGKAMLTFLLVPFLCLGAIALSTVVLLQLIVLFDSANERGEAVSMEGALFLSAVAPENVVVRERNYGFEYQYNVNWDTMEVTMDWVYVDRIEEITNPTQQQRTKAYNDFRDDMLYGRRGVGFSDILQLQKDLDVWAMMFSGPMFFTWLASWFSVIMLLMIVMVFLRRIFEVIVLYLVSPFFVSAIPLDDGKRFSGWRDMFISRLVSGFGSIFTLKVFLLMLPMIWTPNLKFSDSTFIDSFFKVILMMGGIYSVYKGHTLISTIINPQGAMAEQESAGLMSGAVIGGSMALVGGAWNLATGGIAGASAGGGNNNSSSAPPPASSGNKNPNL